MENVVGEVCIEVSEGASHIVVLTVTAVYKLLEFGQKLVIAALACIVYSEFIVNIFSAVKTENNVAHFLVGKFNNLIVNTHTVGGEGEAEVFVLFLFNASCLFIKLFHNIPVEKRLTAEEVNLKVSSCA